MDTAAIPEYVTIWLVVNVGAFLLLAVMSYFGSAFVLERLQRVDRWMYAKEHEHKFGAEAQKSPDISAAGRREE